MADEKKEGNVMNDLWLFVGALAALIVVWYFAGGPGKTDLRGLFIAPPPPVGSGDAYGPQIGTPSTATTTQFEYTNQYGSVE